MYHRKPYRTELIEDKLMLVTHIFEDGEQVKLGNKFETGAIGSEWIKTLGAVKVIGEVSKDALSFVKEGQEFDEYELWWYSNERSQPVMKYIPGDEHTNFGEYELQGKTKKVCKIKCPTCNNFH